MLEICYIINKSGQVSALSRLSPKMLTDGLTTEKRGKEGKKEELTEQE